MLSSLLLASATAAFNVPAPSHVLPATARAGILRLMAVQEPATEEAEDTEPPLGLPIFTLKERDDGWDDVRESIKFAKKDRVKAWDEVNSRYLQPAARWSKVLSEEVGVIMPTNLEAPTVKPSTFKPPKLPAVSRASKKEAVAGAVQGFAALLPKEPASRQKTKDAKVVPAVANVAFPAVALALPASILAFLLFTHYVH